MKTLQTATKELGKSLRKYSKTRKNLVHWCSAYVDRLDPSYFKSKFGEKLDGGYGQSM
jgi:hypothetical protein